MTPEDLAATIARVREWAAFSADHGMRAVIGPGLSPDGRDVLAVCDAAARSDHAERTLQRLAAILSCRPEHVEARVRAAVECVAMLRVNHDNGGSMFPHKTAALLETYDAAGAPQKETT